MRYNFIFTNSIWTVMYITFCQRIDIKKPPNSRVMVPPFQGYPIKSHVLNMFLALKLPIILYRVLPFIGVKGEAERIIIVRLHNGRVAMGNRKIVKEHLQRLIVVVGEVNVRISRLLHNDLPAKFFVRHIGAAFFGGSGHRHVGGVKKTQVLVKEQDVEVGSGASIVGLCCIQKPLERKIVAPDGRDGLDHRARGSRATGYGRHQVLQGRRPVAWVGVEVLGIDLGPYGVAGHYGQGPGKADAFVFRAVEPDGIVGSRLLYIILATTESYYFIGLSNISSRKYAVLLWPVFSLYRESIFLYCRDPTSSNTFKSLFVVSI